MSFVRTTKLAIVLVALFAAGCKEKTTDGRSPSGTNATQSQPSTVAQTVKRSRAAMGTLFDITVALVDGRDRSQAEDAIKAAMAEIERVEGIMSTWRQDSPISKLNAAPAGRAVPMPEELVGVIREAKKISKLTGGKFDISFAVMDGVWDFRSDEPRLPKKSEIKDKIRLIDWKSIRVDEEKSTVALRRKGMKISLGAIAKGYAADRAGAVLEEHGFHNYIVYGGGDLLIKGTKGDRPWKVGIQDPRTRNRYFARLSFDHKGAIVTSGDYEKFFIHNGRRYHHIIDPETGYPAQGTVSVTVIAETAMAADALATGVFVLGLEEGMALVESLEGVEALIVDENLEPHVSSGMKKVVELTPIAPPAEDSAEKL